MSSNHKTPPETVAAIRRMFYVDKFAKRRIAALLGLAPQTVRKYTRGKMA